MHDEFALPAVFEGGVLHVRLRGGKNNTLKNMSKYK
jgi:hypothetical protein